MLMESNPSSFLSLKSILKKEIEDFQNDSGWLSPSLKDDGSFVTQLDITISDKIKEYCQKKFPPFTYYSEEDYTELKFPAVIVDPIDGTKGLVNQTWECAISMAYMETPDLANSKNTAWLYHPFNLNFDKIKPHHTLVSRSEFNRGMHARTPEHFPIGSIALKLLLLSEGFGDCVYSLRAKNLWDIAGGTQLLFQKGYSFFEKGNKIECLERKEYDPPLVWGKTEILKKKKFI